MGGIFVGIHDHGSCDRPFETFSNMWSFRVLEMVLGGPGEGFTYGSYPYLYSYSVGI